MRHKEQPRFQCRRSPCQPDRQCAPLQPPVQWFAVLEIICPPTSEPCFLVHRVRVGVHKAQFDDDKGSHWCYVACPVPHLKANRSKVRVRARKRLRWAQVPILNDFAEIHIDGDSGDAVPCSVHMERSIVGKGAVEVDLPDRS